jgi:hypothetical protein
MPNEFQLRVESLHSLVVIDITFLAIALLIWCRDAGKNEMSQTTWRFGHQNQWCPSLCFERMSYNGFDEISSHWLNSAVVIRSLNCYEK